MSQKFSVDNEAVRKLAEILKETDLTEIEYEAEGNRIYVSRQQNQLATSMAPFAFPVPSASSSSVNQSMTNSTDATSSFQKHPGLMRSPMVGTAYLAPEPGANPFVKVGDSVSEGQILLIVEAMKVMNPIKALQSGKITQIFCQDKAPIEYDEPLMVIE